MNRILLISTAIGTILLFSGCMGVKFGFEYGRPDGSTIGGTIELDPTFAKQKK